MCRRRLLPTSAGWQPYVGPGVCGARCAVGSPGNLVYWGPLMRELVWLRLKHVRADFGGKNPPDHPRKLRIVAVEEEEEEEEFIRIQWIL